MRRIENIVLHCTATGQNAKIENIQRHWRERLGWRNPGYHVIIEANGNAVQLAPYTAVVNGVGGHNSNSIHISYIGGIDANNRPLDNRTPAQVRTMLRLVIELMETYPNARVLGHRDFPNVAKACPSFDVNQWLRACRIIQ
jgi:N-acetylmuramoyl-L-alanine amidase